MSTILTLDITIIDQLLRVRELDEDTVIDYTEALKLGDELRPVTVAYDTETSTYYLVDGFHRTEAHIRNGAASIIANVIRISRQDARWDALGANRKNGRRLSNEDKRHAIGIALCEFPLKSSRDIAAHVGCSHTMVQRHKTKLEEGSGGAEFQLPSSISSSGITDQLESTTEQQSTSDRITGRDGKSYLAKKKTNPREKSVEQIGKSTTEQPEAPIVEQPIIQNPPSDAVDEYDPKRLGGLYREGDLKIKIEELDNVIKTMSNVPNLLNDIFDLLLTQVEEHILCEKLDVLLENCTSIYHRAKPMRFKMKLGGTMESVIDDVSEKVEQPNLEADIVNEAIEKIIGLSLSHKTTDNESSEPVINN